MVKKIINWLKQSNRWKHMVLGFGIGAASDDNYCAALAGTCTAGALEVKDKAYGGKFDWIDYGITLAGVFVGRAVRYMVTKS